MRKTFKYLDKDAPAKDKLGKFLEETTKQKRSRGRPKQGTSLTGAVASPALTQLSTLHQAGELSKEELLQLTDYYKKQAKALRAQASLGTGIAENVLWKPQEGFQTNALSSIEYELLMCGGKGSGKSDTLMVDPLRWVYNPNFRGLFIRKTLKSLSEIISRAKDLYPKFYPGTKWKDQEKIFEFPSGAKIEFGYLDHMDDYDRYHGRQFCWIGVDEIHQYQTDELYNKIKSVLRKIDPNLPLRVRATCNPGGGNWIKEYWQIEGGVKDKKIDTPIQTEVGEMILSRRYLFSNVYDNKLLVAANPEYIAYLHSLPDVLRKRYLDGDFDACEGMAFEEFDRKVHVVEPFTIPNNWVKLRSIDWGYSSRSLAVCLWLAISNEGDVIVYRELAVNKMLARDFARRVLELSNNEYISYSVIDGSVGDKRGSSAPSIDEELRNEGLVCIYADKTSGSRISGKQLIHKYLQIDTELNKPRLTIFKNCPQIIKELGSLPLDQNNPEDIDTTAEDHAYDALRYGLQSRPDPMYNSKQSNDFFGGNGGWRNAQRGLVINQYPVVDKRFGY